MNTNIGVSAAAAVATLLLFAGTPASAHQDHHEQAEQEAEEAVAAASRGWFFAGFRLFGDEWLMTLHRWAGTTTALFACSTRVKDAARDACVLSSRSLHFRRASRRNRSPRRALLYGLDHYAW
jgi:hypothetical protein